MKHILLLYALLAFGLSSCQSQPSGGLLPAKAFSEKSKATKDAVILDVRTPEEFSAGYIDKAINIDFVSSNVCVLGIHRPDVDTLSKTEWGKII